MTETHYLTDLSKRLVAAEMWAQRLERERPTDHQAIARAWAYVRRIKAQIRGAIA